MAILASVICSGCAAYTSVNTQSLGSNLLSLSPTSIDLGNVNVGSGSSQNVTVTNTGNSNVTISGVTTSGAGFSASGVSANTILTPTQSATLSVSFAPTIAGSVTGSVSVVSNASNSPATISLSGTGVTQANSPLCGVVDDGSSIYLPGLSTPNPTISAISNYIPFVPPAKMGTYVDPAFGCTITRLTDGQGDFGQNGGHNYIRSAFNADNTKFLAYETNTGNFFLIDMATEKVLVAPGSLPFGGDTADETWDRTNANIIHFESGNQLLKADISACTLSAPCDGAHGTSVAQTLIHTFTEYTGLDVNNNKKDISDDGCYLPMGGTTSGGNFDAFSYNICTNTKSPVQTCTAGAASHFISGMTHSNRMWIAWGANGTGSCAGTWLFDVNMNPIQQLFTNGPHTAAVYDPAANKEYLVYEASGDASNQVCNGGGTSGIGKTDLQTFAKSCVVAFPYNISNVHVTSNNPYGWWGYEAVDSGNTANDNSTLSSSWQSSWGHLYNEIGVGNISTGQIYRLAHSRTRTAGAASCGGYWTATRPSMSHDGTWIAFDSSMARTNAPLPACIQDYVDTYAIKFR